MLELWRVRLGSHDAYGLASGGRERERDTLCILVGAQPTSMDAIKLNNLLPTRTQFGFIQGLFVWDRGFCCLSTGMLIPWLPYTQAPVGRRESLLYPLPCFSMSSSVAIIE